MASPREHRRRHEIMQAAESLFRDKRLHEITLDEVAQAAHVGKGTIYRYFVDKDDLFFQTATSGFDDLCALLLHAVPGDAPFSQRLLSACQQITAFFNRRRHLLRMMDVEQCRIEPDRTTLQQLWQTKRQRLVMAMAGILEQGKDTGHIRSDVPCEILATFLLGMLRIRSRDLAHLSESERPLQLVLDIFLVGSAAQRGPLLVDGHAHVTGVSPGCQNSRGEE